jgi:hypothetical protein
MFLFEIMSIVDIARLRDEARQRECAAGGFSYDYFLAHEVSSCVCNFAYSRAHRLIFGAAAMG